MEQIYDIAVASFCISKYFAYDNNLRIVILVATYPLLVRNCYNLSLEIHTKLKNKYDKSRYKYDKILEQIFQIMLFSLVINYLQTDEILFDIDDNRRYVLIALSIVLFFYKFFKYYNK